MKSEINSTDWEQSSNQREAKRRNERDRLNYRL